jgi:hypothetical protein
MRNPEKFLIIRGARETVAETVLQLFQKIKEQSQDLRSYCDHCHKFIVIASAAKQSRSTQNTDCNGLLRRLRRLAMTTCLAHFVMEIT